MTLIFLYNLICDNLEPETCKITIWWCYVFMKLFVNEDQKCINQFKNEQDKFTHRHTQYEKIYLMTHHIMENKCYH
jgi:hypothetical protein